MSDVSVILDEAARKLQAADIAGATSLLQQALAIDPQNGRAFGLMGICHAKRGDMNAAVESLSAAARLQPGDAATQFNLANALFQAQRPADARAAAERALAINPSHEAARQLIERIGPVQAAPAPLAEPPTPWGAPVTAPPAAAAPAPWGAQPPMQAPPPSTGGMQYSTVAPARPAYVAPSAGTRVGRGVLWGAIFGQWWTGWFMFWALAWNVGNKYNGLGIAVMTIVLAVVFGISGVIIGLIIAVGNLQPQAGAVVGVVVGLLLCGVEVLLAGSANAMINAFWYFFTGRYIGTGIAARVQRPIVP